MKRKRSNLFSGLADLVVGHPWRVIATWIVAAVAIIALSPGLPTTTDESDFLPGHYESIRAQKVHDEAFKSAFNPSAIVVVEREDGGRLTAADSAEVGRLAKEIERRDIPHVERVVAGRPSPNRLIQTIGIQMPQLTPSNQEGQFDSIATLREDLGQVFAGTGLTQGTTGSVAQGYDQQQASGDADAIVAVGTVVLIVLLLLVIFRSPIIALLPIVVIGLASGVANGLIALLVKAVGMQADNSISSLLIVVLFGVGTDYILFLLFRYRERLRAGEDRRQAMVSAVTRVGEAIASAAGVVIIAFLAMTLSSLSFFRAMGPSLAVAVAVTLLAGLTLVPAIVSLLGPRVFWPSKSWRREPRAARFGALGEAMSRRPAIFASVAGVVMVLLSLAALNFHATFDLSSGSLPDTAESQVALKDLEKGLPPGATDPTDVYLSSDTGRRLRRAGLAAYGQRLRAVDGVGAVAPPKLSRDGRIADFSVTLASKPESDRALEVVKGPLRDTAHDSAPPGTTALVGGITSVYVDIHAAMNRDYSVVFPVAAGLILIILALLLRSLIAPLYLMLSVGLGFTATLGATTLIFEGIGGKSGLIFLLPLIMYMFVVALGTDYNILMMARLREEAKEGLAPRDALSMAIRHTGPTIAAAGVILAGSFAVLLLAGNSLLAEMGFAISFGIVIAAFVMAMLFTPSLTALIGHRAWWPGHGDEPVEDRLRGGPAEAEPEGAGGG